MMLIYEVYYRDYRNRQTEKIAILAERRRDPNRQNGLKWARRMFGKMFRDTHCIFIRPREEKINVG
jgi:hypothetical protein